MLKSSEVAICPRKHDVDRRIMKELVLKKYTLFGIVFVGLVLLDQVTKIWVVNNIAYRTGEIQVIEGFFSLVHTQNSGAAFGIMQGQMIVFAVFTIVAMFVLGHMLWELDEEDRFQNVALAMIGSGAVGNAIDRIHKQSVTDFLRVYTDSPTIKPWFVENFGSSEWPSFNVADAAIVVGLIMFGFFFLFLEKDDDELEPDPPEKLLEDPV